MDKYNDALTYLRDRVLVTDNKQKEKVNECIEILQELIDRYFNNPPLKLEEMRAEWVWDNLMKRWYEIRSVRFETKELEIYTEQAGHMRWYETVNYEENRFYRKQVERWQKTNYHG